MKFVDASVIVAVQTAEKDWEAIALDMRGADLVTSPVAILEAGLVIGTREGISKADGVALARGLLSRYAATVLPILPEDCDRAAQAYDRYGKGSGSKAKLNMGDCFAYAMAKRLGATLLYKGDDFSQTDMA